MNYARIVNGQVAEYPYSISKLRTDNPGVSFPRDIPADLLAEYGVYSVFGVDAPSSTVTQDPVEQTPVRINGAWTQVWAMVDVSPAMAAKRQRAASDKADSDAIKVDAFVQNFIAMTPAQVSAYVTNNTATLAQMRTLVEKMALMLLALARNAYR